MAAGRRVTCVIAADDLTGAADACATFVERGLSGVVRLRASPCAPAADVVAISTESRGLSSAEAAGRVRRVSERWSSDCEGAVGFKKIDSTLRGHIGEELAAVMEAWRATRAIVAPAFPRMGRTLEGGLLRVAGGDAQETDAPQGHLPTLLATQGLRDCRLVLRPSNEPSLDGWASAMASALRSGRRVIVCDSLHDEDLDAIVHAVWGIPERVLWVGSAGLAGALARRLTDLPRRSSAPTLSARPVGGAGTREGSVVFWIGSTQAVTVRQCERVLSDDGSRLVALAAADVDALERHLHAGRHVLLDAGPTVADDALAPCVRVAASHRIAGFVMSGGDTAARVCRALGADAIQIGGEVSGGIPWGWLQASAETTAVHDAEPLGQPARRWPVVLKAGGFGGPDAFVQALMFLTATAGDQI
ncbi:MAG: hypothetical protein GEV06_17645 [Luteitalea sp.]|nr:hypothetical protein [Luteitalea sp.]